MSVRALLIWGLNMRRGPTNDEQPVSHSRLALSISRFRGRKLHRMAVLIQAAVIDST